MMAKLQRYSLAARIIGILILVGVFGVVFYQLYDFYSDRLGYTPAKAISDYFDALTRGDLSRVYEMTDQESLTDIYGRPVTRSEFLNQLAQVRGSDPLPLTDVQAEKVCDSRGIYYYRVTLTSQVAGTVGTSQVVVQLRRVNRTWLIKYPFAILL